MRALLPSLRCLLRDEPRRPFAGMIALMVAASLTEGGALMLLMPVLDVLQPGAGHPGRLAGVLRAFGLRPSAPLLLGLFVAAVAASAGLQYARGVAASAMQMDWVDRLRGRAFAALVAARHDWIVQRRQTDHVDLLTSDIARIAIGLNAGVALLGVLATTLVYLAAALSIAPGLTALVAACGVLAWAALAGQRRRAYALGQSQGAASRALQARLHESLSGIKLAKSLGIEPELVRSFGVATARLREGQLTFQRSLGRSRAWTQVAAGVLLAMFVEGGLVIWRLPLPELAVLALLLLRLVPMFSSAQQQAHQGLNAMPAVVAVAALIAECEAAAEPAREAGAAAPWPVAQAIELRGATLTRPGSNAPALAEVGLRLPARSTTVLIGPSGAGKTTLADVLAGLLVPDRGQLLVDGTAVEGPGLLRWRHSVAYVTQEVFLVNDTIRHNLCWGLAPAPEHTPASLDAMLADALRMACADFVLALPDGLDTVIGDAGVRLSGGERQRVSLARALLRRPSLLILDEATSALDVDNEQRIGEAIRSLHGQVTVLLIGHRLATLEHADQVLVLEHGRLVGGAPWAGEGGARRQSRTVHP